MLHSLCTRGANKAELNSLQSAMPTGLHSLCTREANKVELNSLQSAMSERRCVLGSATPTRQRVC